MARTVTDTALMLSVLAGPDDRAPISYDVDTRAFSARREGAVRQGLARRLDARSRGLIPVDDEVAGVAESATRVFRSLGARVEAACPDFGEVNEIVLGTRGRLDGRQLRPAPRRAGRTRCRRGSCGTSSRGSR